MCFEVSLNFTKVQVFLEGHKNVRNSPYDLEIYLVNVKTITTIAKAELYRVVHAI